MSLRSQFPLHLLIGGEDCTFLLDEGFTFSNVDPGGFEMASFPIPKDMPETIRGQPVRLDCGLQVAWEGRISEVQRSLGNRTTITCEGYGALAKDQAGAMIFVDRDMSQWGSPTLARQISYLGDGQAAAGTQKVSDPIGNPAINLEATGAWAAGGLPAIEAWYDARGISLADLYYEWSIGSTISPADTNWLWQAFLSTDDVASAVDVSGNLRAAGPGSGTLTASLANRVYAGLQLIYGAAAGIDGNPYDVFWQNIAVYGNHGLTPRYPPGASTGGWGYYPSDVILWILSQLPELQPGTIQTTDDTGYILPHSVYYDPTGFDQILNDMATAAAWNWAVWEAPNFLLGDQRPRLDFQPRPVDGTWQAWAWRQQCDTLDIREDLSGLYDGAIVQYTLADGSDRHVLATIDNQYLDRSGIGRGAGGPGRTIVLNAGTIGGIASGSGSIDAATVATQYGVASLILLMQQARVAGSITITTSIQDVNSGPLAPWMIRAGQQRLRIPDLPSTDYAGASNDLPISRVEASIGADSFSTTLEIGQGASLLETFQARESTAAQIVGL